MKKYSKIAVCFISAFSIVMSSFMFSFTSSADDGVMDFYVHYAEPTTSESQGYISLLVRQKSSNAYGVVTFFWNMYGASETSNMPVYAYITITDSSFSISPAGFSTTSGSYFSVSNYAFNGMLYHQHSSSSSAYTWSYSSGYSILGWHYAGNVGSLVQSIAGDTLFTVNFNQDGTAMLLNQILDYLHIYYSQNEYLLDDVESILNSVDGIEGQLSALTTYLKDTLGVTNSTLASLLDKAEDILAEQEETNSWLEKIYDALGITGSHSESEVEVDGSPIGELQESEDKLLEDTTEYEASLKVTINNGFQLLGELVELLVVFDTRIHVFFISMLTIGFIALVLGK